MKWDFKCSNAIRIKDGCPVKWNSVGEIIHNSYIKMKKISMGRLDSLGVAESSVFDRSYLKKVFSTGNPDFEIAFCSIESENSYDRNAAASEQLDAETPGGTPQDLTFTFYFFIFHVR
jgi:hypothetical protein